MLQFLPSNTFIPPCNPCSVYQFISNERYKLELLFRKATEHEHMETVRLDICSWRWKVSRFTRYTFRRLGVSKSNAPSVARAVSTHQIYPTFHGQICWAGPWLPYSILDLNCSQENTQEKMTIVFVYPRTYPYCIILINGTLQNLSYLWLAMEQIILFGRLSVGRILSLYIIGFVIVFY